MPIVPCITPKDEVKSQTIYRNFSKKYIENLCELLEAYFPPLKIKLLNPIQISEYDSQNFGKRDKKFSYIYHNSTSKGFKIGRDNS